MDGMGSTARGAGVDLRQDMAAMIRSGILRNPAAPFVFWSEGKETVTSAGEIWRQAGRLAGGLKALGLCPGDPVAVQVPNILEGVAAFLAGCRLGAIIVPLVPSHGAHELEFILRQAKVKAIVTPRMIKGVDTVQRIASFGDMPDMRHLVIIGGARGGDHRVVPYEELIQFGPDEELIEFGDVADDVADRSLRDVFAVIYTSGTTGGEPKGAIHTHEGFGRELAAGANVWIPPGEQRAPLVIFPPGHIAGIAYALMPIIDGSGAVYMDMWDARAAASLIERNALSWTFGTPFHLTTLLEAAAPDQLRSLRMFGCGGASVPPSLIERADAAGLAAFRAYGSTEHPSISSGRRDDGLRIRAYTDGRPMPRVEVRILDDAGQPCGPGKVGEITTRGPELFKGYLDPKHDREALVDGWYRTGDLGIIDDEGALTIVDRKKDIVIRGGENISSKEVEDILLELDGVLAVAVVGWPDERYGERVAAFVQMKDDAPIELETIIAHFKTAQIARHKTPERLITVRDFERSAAGKILKVPLRAQASRLAAAELA